MSRQNLNSNDLAAKYSHGQQATSQLHYGQIKHHACSAGTSAALQCIPDEVVLPSPVASDQIVGGIMAPTLPSLDVRRLRSYVFRLPLFTRTVLVFVVVFWILELQKVWNVVQWGALIPKEVNLGTSKSRPVSALPPHLILLLISNLMSFTVYRLNTYPLIHRNFLHALFNTLALTPLLERFEAEHGTLLSGAMFVGRSYNLFLATEKSTSLTRRMVALSTMPAAVYLLVERGILRQNTAILGAR